MKRLILFLLLASALTPGAMAADIDASIAESAGVGQMEEAMPDEARAILGDITVADADDAQSTFGKILRSALTELSDKLGAGVKSAVSVLLIAAMCALALSIGGEKSAGFVMLGGTLAIACTAVGAIGSYASLGREALETLSAFSKLFLPCLAAASAVGGNASAAAVRCSATAMFFDILISSMDKLVMPLISAFLAAVIAGSAVGGGVLSAAAKFMKKLCTIILTVIVTVFTTYITVAGAIAGATGEMGVKLTKTAISTALPVVGSIISDAAGTVIAGAGILRNAIGVFGLAAVLCVCIGPCVTLGVFLIMYKLAAAMAAPVAGKQLSELIDGIGDAFGMMLAAVGAGGIILLVSVISGIKAVSGY